MQIFESESKVNIPNGNYVGHILGYDVYIKGHGSFRTTMGLRNVTPQECLVKIRNGKAVVKLKDNQSKNKMHNESFGGGFQGFGYNAGQAYGRAAYYSVPPPIIINTGTPVTPPTPPPSAPPTNPFDGVKRDGKKHTNHFF